MLATAFLKNRMRWTGIKWRNIIRPGSTLQRPAWDICSFRLLQKTLFLMGSCYELQVSLSVLWTFALWSRGNVDPFVHRILSLLKDIKREL
jgi:hypothetical protein